MWAIKASTKGRALRIAVWIAMLVLLMAEGAATITVDDSGGADYTRIQDAVAATSNGDTIQVQIWMKYE